MHVADIQDDAECCDQQSDHSLKIQYLGDPWVTSSCGFICSGWVFFLFIFITAKCISNGQGPDLSFFNDYLIVPK